MKSPHHNHQCPYHDPSPSTYVSNEVKTSAKFFFPEKDKTVAVIKNAYTSMLTTFCNVCSRAMKKKKKVEERKVENCKTAAGGVYILPKKAMIYLSVSSSHSLSWYVKRLHGSFIMLYGTVSPSANEKVKSVRQCSKARRTSKRPSFLLSALLSSCHKGGAAFVIHAPMVRFQKSNHPTRKAHHWNFQTPLDAIYTSKSA